MKAATGRSAFQDPSRHAFAVSSPARPTYMGFRLTEFAPVVTRTEARAGLIGSRVVPCRRNWPAAIAASVPDAVATATATAAREAGGGCAPFVSADWVGPAAIARRGGGGRITLPRCHRVGRTSSAGISGTTPRHVTLRASAPGGAAPPGVTRGRLVTTRRRNADA